MPEKTIDTKITGATDESRTECPTPEIEDDKSREIGSGIGGFFTAFFCKCPKNVKPPRENTTARIFGSVFLFAVCTAVFMFAAPRAMESMSVNREVEKPETSSPFGQGYHIAAKKGWWVVTNKDGIIELELPVPASKAGYFNDSRSYDLTQLRKEIVNKLAEWFRDKDHANTNRQWLKALQESPFGADMFTLKDNKRLSLALPAVLASAPPPAEAVHLSVAAQAQTVEHSPPVQEDVSPQNAPSLMRWLVSNPPGSIVFQRYSSEWAGRNRAEIQRIMKMRKVTKLGLKAADQKLYENALYLQTILKKRYQSEKISVDGLIGKKTVQAMIWLYMAEEQMSEKSVKSNLCKTLSPLRRFFYRSARRHLGCP